ncbi:hypothetical protein IKD56_02980 [bacterium]|nr:hypothetical protein [bacterium]
MKKSNLKEIYTYINQTTEKEVDFESVDLENNKIKHIIIGNKKVIQTKNQSIMTTKQFQDHVIQFISNQKSFNEYVIEFIQEQKLVNQRQEETNKKQEKFNEIILNEIKEIKIRLDRIESCPTIQKELNNKNIS